MCLVHSSSQLYSRLQSVSMKLSFRIIFCIFATSIGFASSKLKVLKKKFVLTKVIFLESCELKGEPPEVVFPEEEYSGLITREDFKVSFDFWKIVRFIWNNVVYPLTKKALKILLLNAFGISGRTFEVIYKMMREFI